MSEGFADYEESRIFRDGSFEGQVAIVTGGGSGIGLSTSKELLRLGAKVAICGRKQEKLDAALVSLCKIAGAEHCMAMPCDIREADKVDAFVNAVVERFGGVDILVNNAGGQFPSAAEKISPKGFAAVVRNNLNGTFNMIHAVTNNAMIPGVGEKKGGYIVNVIANIYRGFPGMSHTGAARAGVENLSMSLAVEWARYGIIVNCVAPGIIMSSGTKQYPAKILEHAVSTAPMKRAGSVRETVEAILFLCSPGASYITGTTIRVDGGHSLAGDVFFNSV